MWIESLEQRVMAAGQPLPAPEELVSSAVSIKHGIIVMKLKHHTRIWVNHDGTWGERHVQDVYASEYGEAVYASAVRYVREGRWRDVMEMGFGGIHLNADVKYDMTILPDGTWTINANN